MPAINVAAHKIIEIQKKIIAELKKCSEFLTEQNFTNFYLAKEKIKLFRKEIKKLKYDNILTQKISELYYEKINYLKETIFDLRIATSEGNFTDPVTWTVEEVIDFINLKKKQIEKQKNNMKNGRAKN